MIKKELLDIIADLNWWHRDQESGIEREKLKDILKLIDMKGISLIVSGVRRAGKTYLAKQILKAKIKKIKKEQTLYINFEDKKLEPFLSKDILDDIYETYRYYINKKDFSYIVLDEVQNVNGWEKWVRMMLEKKENIKIIITGSGSKIITPKLTSVLTGRKITFSLYPLSFKEFLHFKGIKKIYFTEKDISSLMREYIELGSFPMVVLADNIEQKKYFLQEIYDDIAVKDIISKYHLREENTLKKIAYLTLNNFSRYVSIRKLRNSLKTLMGINVSPSTLSNYLNYFENSFLFVFFPIFSYKVKDQMQYPKKVYCIDTGMINAVIPKFSENIGNLYENIVAIQLKRKLEKNAEIYYWKDDKGEVDFMIKKGLKIKKLIQVCFDLKNKKTKNRETSALIRAAKELKCNDLLVINREHEKEENINGKKIKFLPLWKWLLK